MTRLVMPATEGAARHAVDRNLRALVEGGGYGTYLGLGQIVSLSRDHEPIVGDEASEFSREAAHHPERYRPIVRFVRDLCDRAGLTAPHVLDFGCGPAILSAMIARAIPGAHVTGVDISRDMIDLAAGTLQTFGVAARMTLHHHDARLVARETDCLADLVVSRNMLHRLDGLGDALTRMVSAARPRGGMACITAFRQVSDLGPAGQAAFVAAVRERRGTHDVENLIRSFVRAHLSAPTLEQYRRAAGTVARHLNVREVRVWAGKNNNVCLYFQR